MTNSAVEYRERVFEADVSAMRAAGGNRVSLVSLLDEDTAGGGPIGNHGRAFRGLERRDWFLWCFFFDALLDQAIHTAGRATKTSPESPDVLKLCGILASHRMNLHPALLLLTASLLVGPAEEEVAETDFRELLCSEMSRYTSVLQRAFAGSMVEPCGVYSEMAYAMALLQLPNGFASFSRRRPNLGVFGRWTRAVAEAIGERSK